MPKPENNKRPILPVIEQSQKPRISLSNGVVHVFRIVVFCIILLLVRLEHEKHTNELQQRNSAPSITPEEIGTIVPAVNRLSPWTEIGTANIVDTNGESIGSVVHTGQQSRSVIGYVGSTVMMVVFDSEQRVVGIKILSSEDTHEHVNAIRDDNRFMQSWNGLQWNEVRDYEGVLAVSGATLTSLAITESIRRRFGGSKPSLKFPNPVLPSELRDYFPEAKRISSSVETPSLFEVHDSTEISAQSRIGFFLRTSPVADLINGYQGPSDSLVLLGPKRRFIGLMIRSSFDNSQPEPFVEYVQQDEFFTKELFAGMSPEEISKIEDEQFEGISGATMTSQGVFRAIRLTAKKSLEPIAAPPTSGFILRLLTLRNFGTVGVLLWALLLAFYPHQAKKKIRIWFLWILVVYFGFLNGDLISQTLLVGWTQNGIPWQNAFGLMILTAAAFIIPVFTGRNVYCHHICPFGAGQQIIRRFIRRPVRISPRVRRAISPLPAILIIVIFSAIMMHWSLNLAAIEPFDAFALRIAGWSTISIAVGGLIASMYVPMAYCRFGCPTGAILENVRWKGRTSVIGRRDWVAVGLLGLGLIQYLS
ncbi:MAG: FMN-binding protein [Pirellulaceae bacterium]|nr:FMN-binding protein [Pirellulaceae bacterium]